MIDFIDSTDKFMLFTIQSEMYHSYWADIFYQWNEALNTNWFKLLVLVSLFLSLGASLIRKFYTLPLLIGLGFGFDRMIHWLKYLIGRPRPNFDQLGLPPFQQCLEAGGFAFPSGHASVSFFVLTIVYRKKSKWNYFWLFLCFGTVLPRVYCGIHYISDIVAGALLGILCGYLTKKILFEKRAIDEK